MSRGEAVVWSVEACSVEFAMIHNGIDIRSDATAYVSKFHCGIHHGSVKSGAVACVSRVECASLHGDNDDSSDLAN